MRRGWSWEMASSTERWLWPWGGGGSPHSHSRHSVKLTAWRSHCTLIAQCNSAKFVTAVYDTQLINLPAQADESLNLNQHYDWTKSRKRPQMWARLWMQTLAWLLSHSVALNSASKLITRLHHWAHPGTHTVAWYVSHLQQNNLFWARCPNWDHLRPWPSWGRHPDRGLHLPLAPTQVMPDLILFNKPALVHLLLFLEPHVPWLYKVEHSSAFYYYFILLSHTIKMLHMWHVWYWKAHRDAASPVDYGIFTISASLPNTLKALLIKENPQCLATCLINGSSTTLWEIRVMRADGRVHMRIPFNLFVFPGNGEPHWAGKSDQCIDFGQGGIYLLPQGIA